MWVPVQTFPSPPASTVTIVNHFNSSVYISVYLVWPNKLFTIMMQSNLDEIIPVDASSIVLVCHVFWLIS